jgi:hypothetical protein
MPSLYLIVDCLIAGSVQQRARAGIPRMGYPGGVFVACEDRAGVLGEQVELPGFGNGRSAAADAQLAVDADSMLLHRF